MQKLVTSRRAMKTKTLLTARFWNWVLLATLQIPISPFCSYFPSRNATVHASQICATPYYKQYLWQDALNVLAPVLQGLFHRLLRGQQLLAAS
eukprot:1148673-Pelagomonas_calceolata.AAC.1